MLKTIKIGLDIFKTGYYAMLAGFVWLNFFGENNIKNWSDVGSDTIKYLAICTIILACLEAVSNGLAAGERINVFDNLDLSHF